MGDHLLVPLAGNASDLRVVDKLFCNFFVAFLVNFVALAKQSSPPNPKTTQEDVRAFLQRFREKASFLDGKSSFPIYFRDGSEPHDSRCKNTEALPRLDELGVSAQAGRRAIIESLVFTDYSEGPITNTDPHPNPGDLWVFGKYIKGELYYIKLQMGHLNKSCICVSFHPTSSLRFPFQ